MANKVSRTVKELFEQLGMRGSDADIERFIEENRPVPKDTPLHEARFWNSAQSSFLKEASQDDSEWKDHVNKLDDLLRKGV